MTEETPVPDAVEIETSEIEQSADLACVMRGQFALYQRGNGSMEIFYDVGDGVMRKQIPAAVVAMAMGKGPMAGMLRKAFGG